MTVWESYNNSLMNPGNKSFRQPLVNFGFKMLSTSICSHIANGILLTRKKEKVLVTQIFLPYWPSNMTFCIVYKSHMQLLWTDNSCAKMNTAHFGKASAWFLFSFAGIFTCFSICCVWRISFLPVSATCPVNIARNHSSRIHHHYSSVEPTNETNLVVHRYTFWSLNVLFFRFWF